MKGIKGINIGDKFGSLKILAFESRLYGKKTPKYEYFAYCFCTKYNRFGWTRAKKIREGSCSSGSKFPIKPLKESDSIEAFISQFPTFNERNYLYIHHPIEGKMPYHNLIWRANNGWQEIPKGYTIDHIDRNTYNNDIINLRLATIQTQNQNRKVQKNNATTKIKGIHRKKDDGKFEVRYKGKYLGIYKSLEEAINVRKAAENASCTL